MTFKTEFKMMLPTTLLFVGLVATSATVKGECKKKIIASGGQNTTWQTVCDSEWAQLGTNMGWAKGCGYTGELGQRLQNIHTKIKGGSSSDSITPDLTKIYQKAYLKMLGYDSYTNCSKERVEGVVVNAERLFGRESGANRSRVKAKPLNIESIEKQDILENNTALIIIDRINNEITVKSDGDKYLRVWKAVKKRESVDIGFLVSDKKLKPKRFEFTWNPLRNSFASRAEGVSTIFVDDERLFLELIRAYEQEGQYVYVAAKLNNTMEFSWWRLRRATR